MRGAKRLRILLLGLGLSAVATEPVDATSGDWQQRDAAGAVMQNLFAGEGFASAGAVVQLYADDAVLVPPTGGQLIGQRAIAEWYERRFSGVLHVYLDGHGEPWELCGDTVTVSVPVRTEEDLVGSGTNLKRLPKRTYREWYMLRRNHAGQWQIAIRVLTSAPRAGQHPSQRRAGAPSNNAMKQAPSRPGASSVPPEGG